MNGLTSRSARSRMRDLEAKQALADADRRESATRRGLVPWRGFAVLDGDGSRTGRPRKGRPTFAVIHGGRAPEQTTGAPAAERQDAAAPGPTDRHPAEPQTAVQETLL